MNKAGFVLLVGLACAPSYGRDFNCGGFVGLRTEGKIAYLDDYKYELCERKGYKASYSRDCTKEFFDKLYFDEILHILTRQNDDKWKLKCTEVNLPRK